MDDYNDENAFIKSGVDSCGNKWIELIPSRILYNYYVDSIHLPFPSYKRMVTEMLLDTMFFDRCNRNEIKGIKVNESFYYFFKSFDIDYTRKKYFDSKGALKAEWQKYQYDLYAYFYDYQIRLIWKNNNIYVESR